MKCGSTFYLKSNQAVSDELQRISRYLQPPDGPACPNSSCENHAQGVISRPSAYYRRQDSSRLSALEMQGVWQPVLNQKAHGRTEETAREQACLQALGQQELDPLDRQGRRARSADRKSTRLNSSH